MAKGKQKKGSSLRVDHTGETKELDEEVVNRAIYLEQQAMDLGMLTTTRPEIPEEVLRVPRSLYEGCNGAAINNKGKGKNKVLLVFPMVLKPTSFGQLGTLSKLNTLNPELYVDFPKRGRLAYLGTHVYTTNKYVHLSYPIGGGSQVKCGGAVESLIVFADYEWRGTMLENPKQTRLPLPEFLIRAADKAKQGADKVTLTKRRSSSDEESEEAGHETISYKDLMPDESDEELQNMIGEIALSDGSSEDDELVFTKNKKISFCNS